MIQVGVKNKVCKNTTSLKKKKKSSFLGLPDKIYSVYQKQGFLIEIKIIKRADKKKVFFDQFPAKKLKGFLDFFFLFLSVQLHMGKVKAL